MLLHEAIKKARQDLRLSQKKLSEMAGIQRRQLATLEQGGNVTLATLRKVLVHLPNLETFTLEAVTATVRRDMSADERQKAVEASLSLVTSALQTLAVALREGRLPDPDMVNKLKQGNEILYQGMGYSHEDLERERAHIQAERAIDDEPEEEEEKDLAAAEPEEDAESEEEERG
jgi:transcriptional regulator with XRE-family HTH domain